MVPLCKTLSRKAINFSYNNSKKRSSGEALMDPRCPITMMFSWTKLVVIRSEISISMDIAIEITRKV